MLDDDSQRAQTARALAAGPDLASYTPSGFSRGRSTLVFVLWIIVDALLISSWLPGSWHRRALLRAFGARIGRGVVIKPRVRVKLPWRLSIGDFSWIGEDAWIDNLVDVRVGSNACLSQGAYLCTGSHDWSRSTFNLITKPITVGDGAWIAAKACIGPGVRVGEGAVIAFGSVVVHDVEAGMIVRGNPAKAVRARRISDL